MIKNSGCVSKNVYNGLRARDAARRDEKNTYDVFQIKKNGELYKKPFGNQGFRSLAEAEERIAYWEKLNPGTKFAAVAR